MNEETIGFKVLKLPENKLLVIKCLKDELNMHLKDAKYLVDVIANREKNNEPPVIIGCAISESLKQSFKKLVDALNENGVQCIIAYVPTDTENTSQNASYKGTKDWMNHHLDNPSRLYESMTLVTKEQNTLKMNEEYYVVIVKETGSTSYDKLGLVKFIRDLYELCINIIDIKQAKEIADCLSSKNVNVLFLNEFFIKWFINPDPTYGKVFKRLVITLAMLLPQSSKISIVKKADMLNKLLRQDIRGYKIRFIKSIHCTNNCNWLDLPKYFHTFEDIIVWNPPKDSQSEETVNDSANPVEKTQLGDPKTLKQLEKDMIVDSSPKPLPGKVMMQIIAPGTRVARCSNRNYIQYGTVIENVIKLADKKMVTLCKVVWDEDKNGFTYNPIKYLYLSKKELLDVVKKDYESKCKELAIARTALVNKINESKGFEDGKI
jgi:hypothetical protein